MSSIFVLALLVMSSSTAALGPLPVDLGSAGNFVVLSETGISTVPDSVITGDIAVSPGPSTALTGFNLAVSADGTDATSSQVTGNIFASSFTTPTPATLNTAILDMETAYTNASGRVNPDQLNVASGNLGGLTLAPGLYTWTTGITIPTAVTLSGGPLDTWIFQIAGTMSMAAGNQIVLAGGALPQNIFWIVANAVTLGTNTQFEGVILCATAITLQTGASLNGRIFAQTAVALQSSTITQPIVPINATASTTTLTPSPTPTLTPSTIASQTTTPPVTVTDTNSTVTPAGTTTAQPAI
ncbi:antifreeze protein [Ramaria rubella]|nr:antifreeze protein [Ramaria rubella]